MSLEIPQLIAARRHQQMLAKGEYHEEAAIEIEPNNFNWRMRGKYKYLFPGYFTTVYINELDAWFILGGNGNRDTTLMYSNR